MKNTKKTISMVLATMLIGGCFVGAGCGRGGGENIDDNRSQLYIGFFEAGFGKTWFDEAVKEFEIAYADYPFEDGKTGVQIVEDPRKEPFKPNNLLPNIHNYQNYMYIVSVGDYDKFYDAGVLTDMTSVITEKVYDENGEVAALKGTTATKSMKDFLNSDYAKLVERDGKFYGLPESYYVPGLFYDADYFNEKALYLTETGEFGAKQKDIDYTKEHPDDPHCGAGPDGKYGTLDDGMPATYDEFKELLHEIVEKKGIPMTWAGDTTYQARYAYEQFWANYEGAEEFRLNYTWDGESVYATDGGSHVVTKDTIAEISSKQKGREYGIQLFYDVVKGEGTGASKKLYYPSNLENRTYLQAQEDFLRSKRDVNGRIAMFMEGGYWETEARNTFDAMGGSNGYGLRDFRLLPVPNVDGQTNTNSKEVVVTKGGNSLIFFTDKCTTGNLDVQNKIATKFLQFISARSQVVDFTKNTGACFKPFTYGFDGNSLTEAEISTFTKYAQSAYRYMCEAMKDGDNAVVHSAIRHEDRDKLVDADSPKFMYFDGKESSPAKYFLHNSSASVKDCFTALQAQVKISLGGK